MSLSKPPRPGTPAPSPPPPPPPRPAGPKTAWREVGDRPVTEKQAVES